MSEQTFSILKKPTFDLTKIDYQTFDLEQKIIYFRSRKVLKFDKCYGLLVNRSRNLRPEKDEAKLVENVFSAVIDAGFCGFLSWKTKLTSFGAKKVNQVLMTNDLATAETILAKTFQDCQQLFLHPCPQNYYDGTNQTTLKPEIIFYS